MAGVFTEANMDAETEAHGGKSIRRCRQTRGGPHKPGAARDAGRAPAGRDAGTGLRSGFSGATLLPADRGPLASRSKREDIPVVSALCVVLCRGGPRKLMHLTPPSQL